MPNNATAMSLGNTFIAQMAPQSHTIMASQGRAIVIGGQAFPPLQTLTVSSISAQLLAERVNKPPGSLSSGDVGAFLRQALKGVHIPISAAKVAHAPRDLQSGQDEIYACKLAFRNPYETSLAAAELKSKIPALTKHIFAGRQKQFSKARFFGLADVVQRLLATARLHCQCFPRLNDDA